MQHIQLLYCFFINSSLPGQHFTAETDVQTSEMNSRNMRRVMGQNQFNLALIKREERRGCVQNRWYVKNTDVVHGDPPKVGWSGE